MARRSGHGVAERTCGYRGGKDCSVKPNPLLKHHSGDFVPEFVDLRRFLHRSPRFREPIAGVAQVAFDEMEQRMELEASLFSEDSLEADPGELDL